MSAKLTSSGYVLMLDIRQPNLIADESKMLMIGTLLNLPLTGSIRNSNSGELQIFEVIL